ncbi:ficolin-2-like [Anopheles ziemanni]|uniref:ficolin-2-like n=1 Tax=Anopheles coustani TaxID=139045 RepID=UPI00265A3C64|nr:ficolin-2-like [Anopheles coustani]XP_058170503.1 ficolin-2-like [Anopheles ziemanni]
MSSVLLRWCFVICMCLSTVRANSTASNIADQPIAGYGYETLSAKMDFLQYKLLEMELGIKERDEELAEKQVQFEKVLSNMLGSLHRLEQAVGTNLTALQTDSWKILAQQSACASHEQMRKEIEQIAPKDGVSKHVQSLLALQGYYSKGPFQSCMDAPVKESGVYSIKVGDKKELLKAFCEQNSFGGGWLVIQYRFDGSLDFYRNWTEYRNGFGNVYQEFWIGLEWLHQLTSQSTYELMVEIKDFDGNYRYAHYTEFEIGSETEQYPLKKLGTYSGTAGDSLTYHAGMKFSTKERDNDKSTSNCAVTYEGAWWYNECHYSHFNGRYLNKDDPKSISWYYYKNSHQGLAYSRMMIRKISRSE